MARTRQKPLPAEPKPAPKPELVTRTSPEAVLFFLKQAALEGDWGLDYITRTLGVNRDIFSTLAGCAGSRLMPSARSARSVKSSFAVFLVSRGGLTPATVLPAWVLR